MKVFFIVPYYSEGASNRYRVEQYFPYLKERGIVFKIRPFVSKRLYKILYQRSCYIKKIFYFMTCSINRLFDILRILRWDIIFIHREAFPLGPAFFEYTFRLLGKPIIYDFDDAIFLPNASPSNNYIERFKNSDKISKIIGLSDHVIVGNRYLYDFTHKFNKNITIIPTPIDENIYLPETSRPLKDMITVGWIGSSTTAMFLGLFKDMLKELSAKYKNVQFLIVGGTLHIDGLSNIINRDWFLERERHDLKEFDIGIMPMPDNEWTKGKCGFKAILYMSMGIPCVCSPIGVNKEIIIDGVNGFLADTQSEWIAKLSLLIDDPKLRQSIGLAGRETVEEKYSVRVNAPRFLEVLQKVYRNNSGD